jgi:hypothetical protein
VEREREPVTLVGRQQSMTTTQLRLAISDRNGRPVGGFWAALIGAAIIGSAAIGILYDVSLPAVIVFC